MQPPFHPLTIPRGAFNLADARRGDPGVPTQVRWNDQELRVVRANALGRTTGRDRGGSRERYVDRHWFSLELDDGTQLEAYVLRRVRSSQEPRWWGRQIPVEHGAGSE